MSETHDPMNLTAAELRTEYSKALAMVHELATARAAEATQHQQEIAAKDAHIANLEHMVREHGQFGDLFQPGGRFHREAQLEPGSVAVVAGGKWLVARLAAVEAERDAERQRWMDARAREIEHSIRADRAEAERDRLKADQQDWRNSEHELTLVQPPAPPQEPNVREDIERHNHEPPTLQRHDHSTGGR